MDGNTLFFTMLFSVIGIGFFSYGKKNNVYFAVAGIALMVYPYAVETLTWLIIVGILLVLLPFLLNRFMPM